MELNKNTIHKTINDSQFPAFLVLVSGVSLALIQFLYNRSLWQDEASLALNIINLNFIDLFRPLNGGQVAPVLFLVLEKFFSLLIPNSEFGLRLFPLICYLVTLFFFYFILKSVLRDENSILFSLALFVFSTVIIRYSSEVKQYMTDVMVCTIINYLTIKKYSNSTNMFVTHGAAGIIAVFLSNIAPVVLLTSGLYLVFIFVRGKSVSFNGLIIVLTLWVLAFLTYYYFFIHDHPHKNMMTGYWTKQGSFLPLNLFSAEFLNFAINKSKEIFNVILPANKIGIFIFLPLFSVGIFAMIRERKNGLLFLCITPVVIHLALSACKLYPFAIRLVLYLSPLVIIIIGFGTDFLLRYAFQYSSKKKIKLIMFLFPVILFVSLMLRGFPVEVTEIKKCLTFLAENKRNDEVLFVDAPARSAYKYYRQIGKADIKKVKVGTFKRKNEVKYFLGLSESKTKLWLLLGSQHDVDDFTLLDNLGQNGITCTKKFSAQGTSVWLFDMNK